MDSKAIAITELQAASGVISKVLNQTRDDGGDPSVGFVVIPAALDEIVQRANAAREAWPS